MPRTGRGGWGPVGNNKSWRCLAAFFCLAASNCKCNTLANCANHGLETELAWGSSVNGAKALAKPLTEDPQAEQSGVAMMGVALVP